MSIETRAAQRKYHFTYQVTCSPNGRVFYGVHSSNAIDDGFTGKGSALFRSIENHGKEQHTYQQLELFVTRKLAVAGYNELKASQIVNPRKPADHKYHFVYKTTRFDGKYYYGVHSTSNLDDGYMGSGVYISRSLAYHGRDKHITEIVKMCETREHAFVIEAEIVTPELLLDVVCMNKMVGGNDHGGRVYGFTEESLKKISDASKAAHAAGKHQHMKMPHSPETIAKRSAANTGKKRTAEQVAAHSAAQKLYYTTAEPNELIERRKKSAEKRAKVWMIENEAGEVFEVKNLNDFGKLHQIASGGLYKSVNTRKFYNGFRVHAPGVPEKVKVAPKKRTPMSAEGRVRRSEKLKQAHADGKFDPRRDSTVPEDRKERISEGLKEYRRTADPAVIAARQKQSGETRSKIWIIENEAGETFEVKNLGTFSKENNINGTALYGSFNNRRFYNGFRIFNPNPRDKKVYNMKTVPKQVVQKEKL